MTPPHRLSKSTYLAGLQCNKRLWLEYHRPHQKSGPDQAAQRLFKQGRQIGELARQHFPGGLLISGVPFDIPKALHQTQTAIETGQTVLYEAAFSVDDLLIVADILCKKPDDSWQLIEVKMSTSEKPEHLHDLAIQRYTLERCGLTVSQTQLMLVNSRDCIYPELDKLFYLVDVTEKLSVSDVASKLDDFQKIVEQPDEPQRSIGRHCHTPQSCTFKDYCWSPHGTKTIFHLPGLHYKKKDALIAQGTLQLADIPPSFKLSPKEQQRLELQLNDQIVIDRDMIKRELDKLSYPLYFLDFETDNPALPRYHGTRPYQQVPFQFSCHVLHAEGRLEHHEFLHCEPSDPRPAFTQALLDCIGHQGDIIAYNANFEASILRQLAASFPAQQTELVQLIERLWDQLLIFKHHYQHHAFAGSNSLKAVLPVLIPDLKYEGLQVANGIDAQNAWTILIEEEQENEELIAALLDYCRLDTLAMVRIHEHLCSL